MTVVSTLRPLLDRKQWEMCAPAPVVSAAGSMIISSILADQLQMFVVSTTVQFLYDPFQDSWLQLPAGSVGVVAAGSGGCYHPMGLAGTATAGSATTLTTNLTIPGSLAGYRVRITGGPGAGREEVILSNTFGTNSVLTFATGTALTNASTFVLITGRFYVFVGGATNTFRFYEVATNTWSALLSVTGVAVFGTDAKLRATPGEAANFTPANSTATAGAATTLTNSAKTWAVNQWANMQVRILSGTGAGQVRVITSNTATVLTVPTWTTNPDATSVYVIEGNDDVIYLTGNNLVTMLRYNIAANTWITVAPGVARAGVAGGGHSLMWSRSNPSTVWQDESNIINGRRLYSFRGGATPNLDYYDIPSNTWIALPYQRQSEVFGIGSSFDNGLNGKFYIHKDSTSRYFQYDVASNRMDPLVWLPYPQGAAAVGDRLFTADFVDGVDRLTFLYHVRNTGVEMFRMLVF